MSMTFKHYSHLNEVHKITDYNKITLDQIRLLREERIYACLDINCFYAQVEERDRKLEGVPIIIGGWKDERNIAHGIVATSNYPARTFGIKTGMSALEATQLCPRVTMFQVDYEKYKAISVELKAILKRYSHCLEMYSLDEAFMDLTGHVSNRSEAEEWIKAIKAEIWREIRLTVNVGISISKTYSKIIADLNKPDGKTIALDYGDIIRTIFPLSVKNMWGVGRRRTVRLKSWGIETIGQIAFARKELLQKIFGIREGEIIWRMARGEEETIIISTPKETIQSISHMHTFPHATLDIDQLWGEVSKGVERMGYRLRGYGKEASEFNLLFRPQHLQSFGSTFRLLYTHFDHDLLPVYRQHFDDLYRHSIAGKIEIRGIGMFATRLRDATVLQFELFKSNLDKKKQMYTAIDA